MQNTAARKRKQVPEGYLVVGVDPHKKRHAAVAITQDFTTQAKFKFDNTREGLEFLLRRARTEMVESGCRGVMFAIETGGHYWRNVAYFLDEQGIPFRFINQFTLKRRREGKDLNRRKNDYRDSEVAAQLLCTGGFTESKVPQGVYAELRTAHNAYRRLVKERTRITNLVKGLLDGLFPEFTQVFKDPCALTALSVLSTCPIPKVIAVLTKVRTDRSLFFIILMRPVADAAPNMPARTIVKARARTGLDPGPSGSKPVKTSDNAKNRTEAITKPTDHLPKEVFGNTLICTMES